MNLRELNYILIPRSNENWDRWTYTRWGRALIWLTTPLHSLTREGQVFVVAILVAGLAGIDVQGSHLYLVFSGMVGLLLSGWLLRPFARLDDIAIRVERPPRVEAGKPITLTVVLRNEGTTPCFNLRIRGPFLPWDGEWVGPPGSVPALEPGEEARVTLGVRFLLRGDRLVGRLRAYSVRPLGIVKGRPIRTGPVRVTVVPPIHAVLGPAAQPREGRQRGRGPRRMGADADELIGVRPYRAGDRIRDLHARSWARLGEPMVREYERPTQPLVHVVLVRGVARYDRDSVDAAVAATASLAAHETRAGNVVRLALVGATSHAILIGRKGSTLEHALDRLATIAHSEDTRLAAPPAASRRAPYRVVFGDWSPALATWWQSARARHPAARAVVVTGSARLRAEAEAAGVATWSPTELEGGLAV